MPRIRLIALGTALSIVFLAAMASRTSAPSSVPGRGTPDGALATGAPAATPSPQAIADSAPTATASPAATAPARPPRTFTAALNDTVTSTARALTAAADSDRIAYAAALRARDASAYAYAATMFRVVAARNGLLAPVASLRRAQVLVSAGDRDAAATAFTEALARADFPDALRVAAYFDAADNAIVRGDPDAALQMLASIRDDAVANSSDEAAAAYEAAQIRHDQGDPRWVDDATAVVALQPWSSQAREALDLLDSENVSIAPLSAAYVRYRAFANDAARADYERAIVGASPADAATAWFYIGALDERGANLTSALDAYERSIGLAPAGPLADDARYWRGRIFEDRGDVAAAVSEYDRLASDFPQSSFTSDARERAAIQLALANNGARGAEALERFRQITLTGSRADAAEAARWYGVFRARLGLTAATPALDPGDFDPTALPALIAARLGDSAGATLTLPNTALAEAPQAPDDATAVSAWLRSTFGAATPGRPSPLADRRYALGRELVYVGEPAVGHALFQSLLSGLAGRPDDLLAVALAFGELGLPDMQQSAAIALLSPLSDAQIASAPRSVLALAYPIAFTADLTNAAESNGIPPLLLAALVRQESAWNATAVSSADALGLTQVTPATGMQIARDLGVEWRSDLLFDPATALAFGAYYLGIQLRTFDGDLAAAVAAYNAGPGSSSRWLEARPIAGTDGFRLAVDFSETARFISRVLENYAWYRYVYGVSAAPALP